MRFGVRLLLVMATLLLVGCPPRASAPLSQPQSIAADGVYRHQASRAAFPQQVERFKRVEIKRYDEAGQNVSVGYNHAARPIWGTVYVYPGPPMGYVGADPALVRQTQEQNLQHHFSRICQEVLQVHPQAQFLERKPVVLQHQGKPRQAMKATFLLKPGSREYSQVYLWIHDRQWYVKYRVSGRETDQAELDTLAQSLWSSLPVF